MGDTATPAADAGLDDRLARYRAQRSHLERNILPLATSVDGRRFHFQASLYGLEFRSGGYVVLEDGPDRRLGQVLTVGMTVSHGQDGGPDGVAVTLRYAQGDGIVLDGDGRAFHDATVRLATPAEVGRWTDSVRPPGATLEVGQLLHAPGVPAILDAAGFGRHTFMCGQSGSGKTYSLGLLLERLLLETSLRMVILDPNSDYVRLDRARADTAADLAARYARVAGGISVRRAGGAGHDPLVLRFAQLSPAARAALLRLDPIADREEHATLSHLLETAQGSAPPITGLDDLLTSDLPGARMLGLRAANLGPLRWSIWAGGRPDSLVSDLDTGTQRCIVVDLGSLETGEEQRVVAEAVLSTLWERRTRREPVLIVIDEAHNICPAEPADPVTALAAEHAVRIAAEGRKFGLHLLVCTQRPQKVQANVVSQCDNLLLMRMNSAADLEYLRGVFSFVPQGLLDAATTFRQGEALVAGRISSHAAHLRFGGRLAEEGGGDVPATWATTGP